MLRRVRAAPSFTIVDKVFVPKTKYIVVFLDASTTAFVATNYIVVQLNNLS